VLTSSLEEYEKLSRMIENLLFLARNDSGRSGISPSMFDAHQEIEEIADYCDALREEKGITITIKGDGFVHADRALFRRALGNVLSNDVQCIPGGGECRCQC
jgi:two-component system, OmpR family, heavy metal sensor histidine kinase CusS